MAEMPPCQRGCLSQFLSCVFLIVKKCPCRELQARMTEISRLEGELHKIQQSASDTSAALLQTQAENK